MKIAKIKDSDRTIISNNNVDQHQSQRVDKVRLLEIC